jgi:hypothetical protein
MRLGHKTLTILFTAFMLISASAQAQDTYRARLSPMPTTPQTKNTITGEGEVIVTLSGNTISVSGHFSGMSSVATMAHIHNGPPAQPGPVIGQLEVPSSTAGDITAELELSDEMLTALKNNSLYVQIHSETNAPGELRGWIFATN